MSGRGRGRGGGGGRGGRGPPRRDQPTPSPSRSYGRGGGGGGRGPTEPPSYQPPPAVLQPVVPATYSAPTTSSVASSSTSSLSREVETKLTLESPAQSVQRPEKAAQAVQQPVSQLPPASSKSYRFPSRPGYGKEGRKCIVRANHFLVTVADKDRHHYDVTINPEVTNKKVCRQIIKTLDDSFRLSHLGNNRLAYDGGKSIYTAGALPFSSKDFVVKLEGRDGGARRDREFRVSIKFASKPDLYHLQQFLAGKQLDAPHETIQLLDVVLRETPSTHYAVVGRSFFSPEFGCGEFGDGLDYWKGFYQSLRPTQMGLSLNINTSARAFYEPILISEFVGKYFNREPNRILSDQDRLKVKKALKGLRVEFRQQEYMRRYKVLSISTQPLSQLKFQDDTGRSISVVQYFRQKYNIPLRYANLPALNAGTDARPIYLPMEVCKIVEGQKFSKKLNSSQVTALLRAVCERPAKREASIKTIISRSNYNNDSIVKEFGIQVGAQFTSIEARVLDPPKLMYHATGKDSQVEPWVGQWNMINKKMVNGGTVEVWACVNFSRVRPDVANSFCHELLSMCCSKGMVFNQQPLLPIQSANPGGIEKALFDIHSQSAEKLKNTGKHLQMLIVILPDVSGSYGRIKRICETELGIVSQCCQPKQVMKCNKQYLENVSLKINVKVGGRNTVLASALARRIPFVSDRPTIIFGADVTHPQPGEDSSPSIAAVVASMDWPEVTKYRGLVSAQDRGEIIKDLYSLYEDPQRGLVHRGMIRELLIAFRKSTNQKPHRIIFYRDGVGEGQFNEVLLEEMDAIRKACQSLEENYLPPVTFVVVQKRHHTRLFPANHNDQKSTDKSGNILPGTVVDTSICHPTQFDFYLCSHAGIQGTSRPTHYHVLYDENNFSADALQSLTNNLCYTYARCTRSVSIVPPAYYAHLAAFRARYYMEGDMSETESTSGGRATREGNVVGHSLPAIKENVKDVMFYC